MAGTIAEVTAPDGTPFIIPLPDYYAHTVAVLGYMRLRKRLPKINPDDENEPVNYEKFKAWIVIGTAEDMPKAQHLADTQGYRGVTEKTVFLPFTPKPAPPKLKNQKPETIEQEVEL